LCRLGLENSDDSSIEDEIEKSSGGGGGTAVALPQQQKARTKRKLPAAGRKKSIDGNQRAKRRKGIISGVLSDINFNSGKQCCGSGIFFYTGSASQQILVSDPDPKMFHSGSQYFSFRIH
jgi:hypothetical protein